MLTANNFVCVNQIQERQLLDLLEEVNDLLWEVNYLHEEVVDIIAHKEEQNLYFPCEDEV
jgi:hypothetical protein